MKYLPLVLTHMNLETELILSAPQEQGHMISSFEKFSLKSPISGTVKVMIQSWKSLVIAPSASLNPQDSPCQTYGCRHRLPNNCSRNSMENVCAFVTADNICLKPPTGWAKQYEKLLSLPKSKSLLK